MQSNPIISIARKAVFASIAFSVLIGVSWSHEGATGIVKQRMDGMKAIAGAIKAIAGYKSTEKEFEIRSIKYSAAIIEGHAAEMVTLFPAGTFNHPSEALPSIVDRREEFHALAEKLENAAKNIRTKTELTQFSDIEADFDAVTSTCKSCHQEFRLKR